MTEQGRLRGLAIEAATHRMGADMAVATIRRELNKVEESIRWMRANKPDVDISRKVDMWFTLDEACRMLEYDSGLLCIAKPLRDGIDEAYRVGVNPHIVRAIIPVVAQMPPVDKIHEAILDLYGFDYHPEQSRLYDCLGSSFGTVPYVCSPYVREGH